MLFYYGGSWLQRRSVAGCLFLIIPFLILCNDGCSQVDRKRFFVIESLEAKELIKTVGKDRDGYLWVATDDGLLRFDGYTSKSYFGGHFAKGFVLASDGKFYTFHDFGITEIRNDADSIRFRPIELDGEGPINRILYPKDAYEDKFGGIWIAEPQSIIRLSSDGQERLSLDENYRSIDYHKSFSFAEDAFDNFWVAAWKGYLLTYDRERKKLIEVPLSTKLSKISSMICVKGDYLLIGGQEGLLMIKVDSDKNILEEHFIPGVTGVSALLASDGDVYAGTWRDGLYRYGLDESEPLFQRLNTVWFTDILDLYLDARNDELWVVSSEAVGLLKDSPVITVPASANLRVESLALNGKGGAYFTTGSEIYYVEDLNTNSFDVLAQSDLTFFNRIRLEDQRLWIGDAFGRISHYDLEEGVLAPFQGDMSSQTLDLFVDSKGNRWLSRQRQSLMKMNESGSQVYENLGRVSFVRESPDGKIYAGKQGQDAFLWIFNEELDAFAPLDLRLESSFPQGISAIDMQFQNEGSALVATSDGLLKVFLDRAIKAVEKVDVTGLNDLGPVNAVVAFEDGICFASRQGLVLVKNDQCIVLSQEMGLPSRMIKDRGLSVDESGNIFVSTAKGIAVVTKDLIRFQESRLPIIESVTAGGISAAEKTSGAVFDYGTRLDVEFGALTFPADNVLYQTRLIGLDSTWSELSAVRNLNFISLPDGDYGLEVRCWENGRTMSGITRFSFIVGSPWYKKWWSLAAFFAGAVAVILVVAKLYNKRLINQRTRLRTVIGQHVEQIYQQKNEIIEQQKELILQKEELISKNQAVHQSMQALLGADKRYLELKEKQLQTEIEFKNKQITTHALNILQKNETLQSLVSQLKEIVKNADKVSVSELKKTIKSIEDSFRLDKDWDSFRLYFEQIHTDFYPQLKVNYPELSALELRHCALIRLNLSLSECATILGISPESIKVSRARIRKKLNLNSAQSLSDFILGF